MSGKQVELTDEQIEHIAERAAEVAFKKIYEEVGKSVLKKLAWMAGAATVGLVMWLGGHGSLPKG